MATTRVLYIVAALVHGGGAQNFLQGLHKESGRPALAAGEHDGLPYPLPEVGSIDLSAYHVLHCKGLKGKLGEVANATTPGCMDKIHDEHCAAQLAPVETYLNATRLTVPAPVCQALFPAGEESAVDYIRLGRAYRTGELPSDPVMAWYVLAGRNFGKLVHKEHNGTLTAAEREYMGAWLSPAAVGQAAVALACDRQDPAVTSAWMNRLFALTFIP